MLLVFDLLCSHIILLALYRTSSQLLRKAKKLMSMFIYVHWYFLFFYFEKIGKEASYQSNAAIGGVMLNVDMWVHVF
jgi:hypothetical protein